jgi:hypothetical protein
MNPMHRDTGCSVGLHLFQELWTLGQQLAHTLLFRQGWGGVLTMFPASTAQPLQPFGSPRSGAGTRRASDIFISTHYSEQVSPSAGWL